MTSRFGETVVVHSTVLNGGSEMIITVRRQSLAGVGSMLMVVAMLSFCFGTIIATNEATLAVKSGMFVISPVCCVVTGALIICAVRRQDSALMDKAVMVGVVSAVVSCVTGVLYINDLMNNMGSMTSGQKVSAFSGMSFILSFLEMVLCSIVSGYRCMMNQNSANAFSAAQISGASTGPSQTPPVYQTPPTTQPPPAYQTPPTTQLPPPTDQWSTPSASWSPPVALLPEYEKPPNYNSIVT